jgi:DNA-binding response OmpR family regulator
VFRIVVAEDDDEMRHVVAEALRKDGHDVVEASDGRVLLAELLAVGTCLYPSRVDLVVSDVRMPVTSGLQILSALREAQSSLPFVLMTAFGDDETRARAEALGAILFDKPFRMADLRATVLKILRPAA